MCKKPTSRLVLISGRSAKALASLMHICASLVRAFAQRGKYFKRVCETVLIFSVPVQTVNALQGCSDVCSHLKMSPMINEPFCEILVLISYVSSIGSNQPAHLRSLARAFTACIAYAHTYTHFNTKTQLSMQ